MLVEKSVGELLTAFSSSDPTPGGGSASALASAVGASLLMMVAGLPKTRTNAPEERAALHDAAQTIGRLREKLTAAIDTDTEAYDRVVAAYRLPKSSAEEQAARQHAIQAALRAATDVPLDVARWSAQTLEQATIVAQHGHRAAGSDVGVAVALLVAGGRGARMNVETNLGGVKDAAYAEAVRSETRELVAIAERAAALATTSLS
jgi:formiminotetrahydrofolate cyclodeaminase